MKSLAALAMVVMANNSLGYLLLAKSSWERAFWVCAIIGWAWNTYDLCANYRVSK